MSFRGNGGEKFHAVDVIDENLVSKAEAQSEERMSRAFRILKRQRLQDSCDSLDSNQTTELRELGILEHGMSKRTKLELLVLKESRQLAAFEEIIRNFDATDQPLESGHCSPDNTSKSSACSKAAPEPCIMSESMVPSKSIQTASPDLFGSSSNEKVIPCDGSSSQDSSIGSSVSMAEADFVVPASESLWQCKSMIHEDSPRSNEVKFFAPPGVDRDSYAKVIEDALDSYYEKLYISQRRSLTLMDWGPPIMASEHRQNSTKGSPVTVKERSGLRSRSRNAAASEKVVAISDSDSSSSSEFVGATSIVGKKASGKQKQNVVCEKQEFPELVSAKEPKSYQTSASDTQHSRLFYNRNDSHLSDGEQCTEVSVRSPSRNLPPYSASVKKKKTLSLKWTTGDETGWNTPGSNTSSKQRSNMEDNSDLGGNSFDSVLARRVSAARIVSTRGKTNAVPPMSGIQEELEVECNDQQVDVPSKIMCPLCSRWFDQKIIEQHASDCNGLTDGECSSETVATEVSRNDGHCHFCDSEFPVGILSEHVIACSGKKAHDQQFESWEHKTCRQPNDADQSGGGGPTVNTGLHVGSFYSGSPSSPMFSSRASVRTTAINHGGRNSSPFLVTGSDQSNKNRQDISPPTRSKSPKAETSGGKH